MAAETRELLRQWHQGDRIALESLLKQHLPWLQEHVKRRLGPVLRKRAETGDFLQETLLEILLYTPRFLMSDGNQFRALLARMAENVVRDRRDWFAARRRDMAREKPLPQGTVIDLDGPRVHSRTPSQVAESHEEEACLRFCLELLDPEDRQIIVLRQWDGLTFLEIGEQLGIPENTVRMRFHRALPRLAQKVKSVLLGQTHLLIEHGDT